MKQFCKQSVLLVVLIISWFQVHAYSDFFHSHLIPSFSEEKMEAGADVLSGANSNTYGVDATGEAAAGLEVFKVSNVIIVQAGGEILYTINVVNNGPDAATNVTVTDVLPVGTSFVTATNGGTFQAGTVTWEFPSIAAGETQVLTVRVLVNLGVTEGTVLINKAQASSPDDPASPKVSNNAQVTVLKGIKPIIDITKTSSGSTVRLGETITYTIRVSNSGNAFATGVAISDVLPTGTTFVSTNRGGVHSNGTVNWNIGLLSPGQTIDITLVVLVNGNFVGGEVLSNIATAVSPSDPDTPKNSAPSQVTVEEVKPEIEVTKKANAPTVFAGEFISYTIEVTNFGTAPATNVTITDQLPAGTFFISADNSVTHNAGTVTWTVGTINPGVTVQVNLVVQVGLTVPNGTIIINGIRVQSPDLAIPVLNQPDPDNEVTVVSLPELVVTKSAASPKVNPGNTISYTITVFNLGTADAQDVLITDVLPTGTTFLNADNGGVHNNGTVTWTIADLPIGEQVELILTVTADQNLTDGTQISNVASAVSPADPANTSTSDPSVVTVEVIAPVLDINKIPGSLTVNAGEDITYTISVRNTGNAPATNLTVTDPLPTNTTFVSADNGGTVTAGVVTWTLGTLEAGNTIDLILVVKVDPSTAAGTKIKNIATADSPDNLEGPIESSADPSLEVTVENLATLEISKAADRPTIRSGQNIVYTISVINNGPSDALGVIVDDVLPAGTVFVSATNGGVFANGIVQWSLGTIEAGDQINLQVTVTSLAALPDATVISNTAEVSSPSDLTSPKSSEPSIVTIDNSSPILEITKTPDANTTLAGDEIIYTITVSNTGNAPATNVAVTDVLPAGTTFIATGNGGTHDAGIVTWLLGTIEPGESIVLVLAVKVGEDVLAGTKIQNIAEADSPDDLNDPVESSSDPALEVEIITSAELTITKTTPLPEVLAGAEIVYTISIQNNGPSTARNITVSDALPASTAFVSADNGGVHANGIVTWTIPTLNAGEKLDIILTVNALDGLATGVVISNIASATSPTDPDSPHISEPSIVTINNSLEDTEVTVSKEVSVASASPGDMVEYTIEVTNIGDFDAKDLVITDTIPDGLMPLSASNQGIIEDNTVTWNIPTIPTGETLTLTVSVMVTLEEGSIINEVQVTGSNFEDVEAASPALTLNQVDLQLSKEVSANVVAKGSTFLYKLTVENISDTKATLVVLTDTLPEGVKYKNATASKGTPNYDIAENAVILEIEEILPGEIVTLEIEVTAEVVADVTNIADVISNEKDSNDLDNQASVSHRQLEFLIPNAFSPNGDGINEEWVVKGLLDIYPNNKLVIVNRLGVEVFRTDNYKNDWSGQGVGEGTYFYQLTLSGQDGKEEVFTGYLTVIK
ncbi:DUF7507 domain-containing protein [Aquiflexum gelatinilyticum]|uniref:Gliding motility-associated C-terminal domain-containing protein n=1 Tax=Aquiflexum gelatinilyticum TaxID=2961943 RepID=A0A9X2T2G0_9BACT|nr:gliding motility-associated C-terminal domain-containing protein [Aquiflexum gelatinilyticum]MCR9016836.1 gliding motility-associated C-terminal domain-containing protein [Aquiflexum gelatinilyticum]